MDRRRFLAGAASLGIIGVWATRSGASSRVVWREDRASFPQGVASGDPDDHSVVLWTRRPFDQGERRALTVEVARDADFRSVVARARAPVLAAADWTCRVLVGGLKPDHVYWYRFTDDDGAGSRIGRTITAPRADDPRPVRFAFVSCQSVNEGAQNAFRRMIWEDERAPAERGSASCCTWATSSTRSWNIPDEVPHRYDRTVYDIGRIPDGRKVDNFHVPTTLDGYRHGLSRAYPRSRTSRMPAPGSRSSASATTTNSRGRAGRASSSTTARPSRRSRCASPPTRRGGNTFPSRVRKASGPGSGQFGGPKVENAPITRLDDRWLGRRGQQPRRDRAA